MDTMVYLVIMLLGIALMLYGFSTKFGIMNLITIPIWIFFIVEFSSNALIVVTMVGLTLANLVLPYFRGGENG